MEYVFVLVGVFCPFAFRLVISFGLLRYLILVSDAGLDWTGLDLWLVSPWFLHVLLIYLSVYHCLCSTIPILIFRLPSPPHHSFSACRIPDIPSCGTSLTSSPLAIRPCICMYVRRYCTYIPTQTLSTRSRTCELFYSQSNQSNMNVQYVRHAVSFDTGLERDLNFEF